MAERWRPILERLEAEHQKKKDWEEKHPPITHISKQEADSKRIVRDVGHEAVTCDLPCHGNHIPKEYSHTLGVLNVFERDISVKEWENPPEGIAAYYGTTCDLTNGKICIAKDERLQNAIKG